MKLKLIAISALALTLTACGGTAASTAHSTPPSPPKPTTFAIVGAMEVDPLLSYHLGKVGRPCTADSGFDDISPGTAVVVMNPNGTKVAIGSLGAGRFSTSYTCSFPFTVEDIPDKWPLYSIEVGHRGQVDYSRKQLSQPVTLTLQSAS